MHIQSIPDDSKYVVVQFYMNLCIQYNIRVKSSYCKKLNIQLILNGCLSFLFIFAAFLHLSFFDADSNETKQKFSSSCVPILLWALWQWQHQMIIVCIETMWRTKQNVKNQRKKPKLKFIFKHTQCLSIDCIFCNVYYCILLLCITRPDKFLTKIS